MAPIVWQKIILHNNLYRLFVGEFMFVKLEMWKKSICLNCHENGTYGINWTSAYLMYGYIVIIFILFCNDSIVVEMCPLQFLSK